MTSPLDDPQFQSLYEVVGPLGRGGMGEVVRIRHRVWEIDLAAKVPLSSTLTSTGGFPQLRKEAETWIRLPSHPHVVTCHYVRTFGGTPVIFIEFVEGGSLAQAIDKGPFKSGATTPELINQALSITLDVAHGLAHAHAAGVVHQDVKPSNVLLDNHGAKLTDFGIANLGKIEPQAYERTNLRGVGTMLATVVGMTPLYASPEQLASLQRKKGKPEAITRATDIWSLGLTLLEMLLGRAPWQPGHVDHVFEASSPIWEGAVDLLRRMLAKDPTDRPKAAEVAEELTAMLASRGITRKPPAGAEMRAAALNNRAVSLLDLDQREEARKNLQEALAIDPCHPEAIFNDTLLAWRAGEMNDRGALDRVRQAISTSDRWEAKLLEAWIHIERGDEKNAWKVLDRVAEIAAGAVRGTRAVARASRAVRDGIRELKSFRAMPGTADAMAVSHDERCVIVGGRNGEVGVFDLTTGRKEHSFAAHKEYVFGVAMTRDGHRVYSAGWDDVLTGHDVETGKRIFQHELGGKASAFELSGDDKKAWTGTHSGTLRSWAFTKRSTKKADVLVLPNDMSIQCISLTPDGQTLLVGGEDRSLLWMDPKTGEVRQTITLASQPYSFAFAETYGRKILLVGRADQHVSIHDAATGEEIEALRGLQSWVSAMAMSRDQRWLVTSNGLHWSLWDFPARRCVRTFEAPALITEAIFLSNGELLTLDWDGMVRRYVLDAPALAPMLVALPDRTRELAKDRVAVDAALQDAEQSLAQDKLAEAIAAARRARKTKGFERAPDVLAVWNRLALSAERTSIRAVWPERTWGPVHASSCMAVDRARTVMATADAEGKVTVWDLRGRGNPRRLCEFSFPSDELASRALSFSANGMFLAIGTYNRLHLFNLTDGSSQVSREPRDYVRDVAFGGVEDSLLATLDGNGHAQVFRRTNLERVATVRNPENWINAVAFFDEDHLIVGAYDGHLLLWNIPKAAASGFVPGEYDSSRRKPAPAEALVRDLNEYARGGQQSISAVQVRDGKIYFGCADKALHQRSIDGKKLLSLTGHTSAVSCFDFLDEHHVVTGSYDKTVRIFDLRTKKCLTVVEGHTHTIWDVVALGPTSFATASDDNQIRQYHIDWELKAKNRAQ